MGSRVDDGGNYGRVNWHGLGNKADGRGRVLYTSRSAWAFERGAWVVKRWVVTGVVEVDDRKVGSQVVDG